MELTEDLIEKAKNSVREASDNTWSDSFIVNLFNQGIINTIDETTIKGYFANPEEYLDKIENLAMYYYISNPEIFQMYDVAQVLSSLNYKIDTIEDMGADEERVKDNFAKIKQILKKVKYKSTTRDMISQVMAAGTLVGLLVGTKTNPYIYIFDDLKYVFPAYIKDNSWMVWMDLAYLDTLSDIQRKSLYSSLSPYITEKDYNDYKANPHETRYVEFPQERSICVYTHKLYRNQRFGTSWVTQSLYDVLHKEKLKALEKSISNRIINSVAVLEIGSSENDGKFDYAKVGKVKGKKIYSGVKAGLEKNQKAGVTVIGIPHWAKLVFPDIKTDGLDPKKFDSINDDLNTASSGIVNSMNGKTNFSSSELTIKMIYKKIGVMLELIEEEVYQKLINWVLSNKVKDEYNIEFNKAYPIESKDRIAILEKLNVSFGGSLKAVLDGLDGVDFDEYVSQTLYEQETLKLTERFKPYESSYTQSGGTDEVEEVVIEENNVQKGKGNTEIVIEE